MTAPIDAHLPAIVRAVEDRRRVVLRAEPAAGKTVRLPPALLDAPSRQADEAVWVVEPRRLAARAAATFVAEERGESVGGSVGFQVRGERAGGRGTRLWYVTDGLLLRRLASDPYVEDIGIVVLDEFHERRLAMDAALAMLLVLQSTVRPDLRIVVASATIDAADLAARLDATAFDVPGRVHPVAVEYHPVARPSPAAAVRLAEEALREPGGDVLVFLPGAREIAEAARLGRGRVDADWIPLHGGLPLDEQRRALVQGPRRRVVLATNVAETSVTVEGVDTVVDTGLAREPRFDAARGWNSLAETAISRASADQRAGRAGRLRPGRCLRMWSAGEHATRRESDPADIVRLDLAPALLDVLAWGLEPPEKLPWVDPPPQGALERARGLLERLGAIDAFGAVTDLGRRMLRVPLEPRLARILLAARERGQGRRGARLVAILSERDFVDHRPGDHAAPTAGSDLLIRVDALESIEAGIEPPVSVHRGRAAAVRRAARELERGDATEACDDAALDEALLLGFPDRATRRREPGSPRGLMAGAVGVVLDRRSAVREAPWWISLDLDAGPRRERREARVRMAHAFDPEILERLLPSRISEIERDDLDERSLVVVRSRRRLWDGVPISETSSRLDDPAVAAPLLRDWYREHSDRLLRTSPASAALLARIRFARPGDAAIPQPDELLVRAIDSLTDGAASGEHVEGRDLHAHLLGWLGTDAAARLDRIAPTHVALPKGKRVSIDYGPGRPPRIRAKIQDLFGMESAPRVGAPPRPLVVELLAPNGRPAQITDDLAGFWRSSYAEVRKALRGRYPKHDWPEDPLAAGSRPR